MPCCNQDQGISGVFVHEFRKGQQLLLLQERDIHGKCLYLVYGIERGFVIRIERELRHGFPKRSCGADAIFAAVFATACHALHDRRSTFKAVTNAQIKISSLRCSIFIAKCAPLKESAWMKCEDRTLRRKKVFRSINTVATLRSSDLHRNEELRLR